MSYICFDLLSNELSVNGLKVQCGDFLSSLKSGFKFPLSVVVAFLELRNKLKYLGIVSDMMVSFCVDFCLVLEKLLNLTKNVMVIIVL